jgi:hypothetical protein
MTDQSDVEKMLKRNTHVKVVKGDLNSRFDPYTISKKREKQPVGASEGKGASLVENDRIVENRRPSRNNLMYSGVTFKSKTEMNFARFQDSLGFRWEYEPITIKLNDGSGERYTPDFFLAGNFFEVKPHNWTPKEGRLGISKMKRGAKRIYELFGKTLSKATYHKGEWHYTQIWDS